MTEKKLPRVSAQHKSLCPACGEVRTVLRIRELLGATGQEDVLARAKYVAEKLQEYEDAFTAVLGIVTQNPRETLRGWAAAHGQGDFLAAIRTALSMSEATVPELVEEVARLATRAVLEDA